MASYLNNVRRGYHSCSIERMLALKRGSNTFLRSSMCKVNVHHSCSVKTASTAKSRVNEINIQMIPEKLHEQIFPKADTKGYFLRNL